MSRRRDLKADERALFEAAMKDAVRIAKPAAKPKAGAAKARKASVAMSAPARAAASLSAKPGGLDGKTAARLARGLLEPEARLDLHGLTEAAAHGALVSFLRAAAARGLRLVLVVTGKGLKPALPSAVGRDDRVRGVLKTMTPRWLAEPELSRFVADVRAAHRRHGGDGALYIYLRKPERRR